MKRFGSILLVLALIISMSACMGKKSTPSSENKASGDTTSVLDKLFAADGNDAGSTGNIDTDNADGTGGGEAQNSGTNTDDEPFKESILVDNDICTITLTGINPDGEWGCELELLLENKSDITYVYSASNAVVNGLNCVPIMGEHVEAGKALQSKLILNTDAQVEIGKVKGLDFSDIRVRFVVESQDNPYDDPSVKESVSIYPFGEEKASTYVRQAESSDKPIMSNNELTASIIGFRYDKDFGYMIDTYMQNHSDRNLNMVIPECRINGELLNPFYGSFTAPGSSDFNTIKFHTYSLDENGISEIKDVKIDFVVYDDAFIELYHTTVELKANDMDFNPYEP